MPATDLLRRLHVARPRFGNWSGGRTALDESGARQALDIRCTEIAERLARAGLHAERMEDADLVRLFHICWSRRGDSRFERDVRSCGGQLAHGRT